MTTTDRRRAGRRVLVSGVGLVLLVACGGTGSPDDDAPAPGPSGAAEPADPEPTVSPPTAEATVTARAVAGGVEVAYRFTNTSAGPVLVVQGPPGSDGQQAAPASVFVTGDGDTVELSRRAFTTPDPSRVDFAQAPRVGATEVAPGQGVSGDFTVPTPLSRVQPYGNDLGYGEIRLPEPATGVRFCLGVLPAPYPPAISLQIDEAQEGGPATSTIAHGNATAASQALLCSEVAPLS